MQDDLSRLSDEELARIAGVTLQPRQSSPSAPRGVRNNNPGNIEDGPFARSLPGYAGSDGRFARFDTPDAGGQAKAQLIGSYIQRGFNTPMAIINRWAPPSDNNPTEQYASYVAQRAGVGLNDRVTEADIPLIAQAIAEFENGAAQTLQAEADDLSTLSDEELMAIADMGQDEPDRRAPYGLAGLVGGAGSFYVDPNAPGGSQATAIDLTGRLYQDQVEALRKGTWVRAQNGEVYQLPGDAFTDNTRRSDEAQGGNIFVRRPNLQDQIGAFASAASEQIPFSDELSAATVGALSGMGYDQARQAQLDQRDLLNQTNRGARVAGGLTGFGVGLALPGGRYVGEGVTALDRARRAGQIGAGYGALYGAGSAEGGLDERAAGAALGAGLGAAGGAVAQGGMERLARVAANARANPSPARQLSREGVSLTPGQMLEATPVVGDAIRKLEDSVTGVLPFVQSARNRGVESFNQAAYNRALSPIGETLPKNVKPGHESVDFIQRKLGEAYDEVLPRVSAQIDQPLYDDIAGILERASGEMEPERVRQLAQVLQGRVFRNVDQADGTITGQQFKAIESELGSLARQRLNAQDPSIAAFGNAVSDIQGALRDMIARQNPAQAPRIQDINRGYANLTRIERAAGTSAADGRGGVFLPGEFSTAVRQGATRSQLGRGDALMQDLATAGRQVLPNTIGDSGTVSRAVGAGIVAGSPVLPQIAVPAAAASLSYSRPAQAAINALYRSTDQPGLASQSLSELARLARDNPALVPVYERALLQAQLAFQSPGQERPRASRGLFGARRPQTASQ